MLVSASLFWCVRLVNFFLSVFSYFFFFFFQAEDGIRDPLVTGVQTCALPILTGRIVFAQFKSALSTPPASQTILPVTPPKIEGVRPDYILLPSADRILSALLPAYVRNSVYRALVETAAGEQGARRTAMKNATDNAGEMLNALRRTFNRARQAQITQEIAEIVGGAAAQQE